MSAAPLFTPLQLGRVPGGICYGYRVRREFDDNGEPVRGLPSIDIAEAATTVWIFER